MADTTPRNSLRYHPGLCTGCGMCCTVCPHGVFSLSGRPVRLLHPEKCIECGACRMNCPPGALSVDSGVGCAWALIKSVLTGKKGTSCCSSDSCC